MERRYRTGSIIGACVAARRLPVGRQGRQGPLHRQSRTEPARPAPARLAGGGGSPPSRSLLETTTGLTVGRVQRGGLLGGKRFYEASASLLGRVVEPLQCLVGHSTTICLERLHDKIWPQFCC